MSTDTVQGIIKAAGGPERIADASRDLDHRITEKGVYSWHRIGIPQKHWPLVMPLASVTADQIYAANQRLLSDAPRDHRRVADHADAA